MRKFQNYANKTVLITGAGGFIGSHLVEYILPQVKEVRCLIHYDKDRPFGWLTDLPEGVLGSGKLNIIRGDVRDLSHMINVMKGVDMVFHLAALISIPYSYIAPEAFIETNIKGTFNICQAALINKVEKLLITSSSEVYGTPDTEPIHETHPLKPQSPYSASKIGADNIAKSLWHSKNLPIVIARPFNTYGPRQSLKAVIPTIITQLLQKQPVLKLGNTSVYRDFTYVYDLVDSLCGVMKYGEFGETYNIGTGKKHQIASVVKMLVQTIFPPARIETDDIRVRGANTEVKTLLADNSKLKNIHPSTKFRPIAVGLIQTIKWFKSNLKDFSHFSNYNI